jgi:hypothetical protein
MPHRDLLLCCYACAGLERLSSAIEAGEALQARVRESLQMRSPLEDLQALADQASKLPVYVPDVGTVHTLLSKAQDWLRKANNLASQVRIFVSVAVSRLLNLKDGGQHHVQWYQWFARYLVLL